MKKHLAIVLIGLLVLLASGGQTLARSSSKDEAKAIEKIKAKIAKLGVGEKARAQITLRNGQKIKGFVSGAGQNDFVFTEGGAGQTTKTIAYSDVDKVQKPGLSSGTKIGIAAAIGVGVTAIVIGAGLRGKIGSPF